MAKKIALLSYEFLFDPSETWAHLYQFEASFAKFLKTEGLQAQVLESINPREVRRVLFIQPVPAPSVMGKEPPKMSPQDVVKKYSDPRIYKEKK